MEPALTYEVRCLARILTIMINKRCVKKILQFTKSGEFVREWLSTIGAQRELGIAQSHICECCNDKRKSAGGYVWRYAT